MDEHMKAVALRMAERIRKGWTAQQVRKLLKNYEWPDDQAEEIVRYAVKKYQDFGDMEVR